MVKGSEKIQSGGRTAAGIEVTARGCHTKVAMYKTEASEQ